MAAKRKTEKPAKNGSKIVAYKAFDSDLKCKGFQYEVGKTYEHDGDVVMCMSGFHACENPLDVLNYYDLGSRFARVTVSGVVDGKSGHDDTKICGASITVEAELTLPDWIAASIEWVMASCKGGKDKGSQSAAGDYSKLAAAGDSSKLAAAGYYSQLAAAGDYSKLAAAGDSSKLAAAGYSSQLAAAGDSSKLAAAGYSSQLAAAGDYSKLAAAGDYSKLAAAGDYSKLAAAGDYSKLAAAGDYSKLAAAGDSSQLEVTGTNGAAAAVGQRSRIRAKAGTPVAICEYDRQDRPIGFATGIAGKNFPADTWVVAKGGKLVECQA